ncbi:hypothetical protein PABG_11983 [Paracoccidioides brasiliensis Pb03]|nr:hypothetical protein PABG_11983 [Paracoccidioides brasiliensis Pb03]
MCRKLQSRGPALDGIPNSVSVAKINNNKLPNAALRATSELQRATDIPLQPNEGRMVRRSNRGLDVPEDDRMTRGKIVNVN